MHYSVGDVVGLSYGNFSVIGGGQIGEPHISVASEDGSTYSGFTAGPPITSMKRNYLSLVLMGSYKLPLGVPKVIHTSIRLRWLYCR